MTLRELSDQLCMCGCGKRTYVATKTSSAAGHVKGEPLLCRHGHRNHHKIFPQRQVDDLYKTEDRGHVTPCWTWLRKTADNGYGHVGHHGVTMLAHRWMYERKVGKIPDGLQLDHLCYNRNCVNPDHLEIVTPAQNQQRRRDAKLNEEKVLEIRASAEVPQIVLADRFGVNPSMISMIQSGKRWKNVEVSGLSH